MTEEAGVFLFLKPFLGASSVIVFGAGIVLLIAPNTFRRLEEVMNDEIGGIKKRIIPSLENTFGSFHKWLLTKTNAIGIICLFAAAIFYIISTKI